MEDWAEIRRLRRSEHMPIQAIARHLGIARNTVKRALASENPPKYERAEGELLPLGPQTAVPGASIVVQQQVEAPLYGVAFYGARHLSVEASFAPDGITSGTKPTVRAGATGRHITARWEQGMLPNLALVRRLGSLCSQLSEHFGFEVDVEWAWTGATVVVLQVRPVTRPLAGWAA